ncbi:hypothetical protein Pfo_023752 [Paulownia fortunei]|nr:hypothetical protein Pfo_023752 [Paulownia fortunei]
MASSMISTAAIASINRATPAQAAPFSGLKSVSALPVTRKTEYYITSIASNGGRVHCMKVWPTVGLKKYETLSYLPTLSQESLAKEIEYLLRQKWIPSLEFELEHGFVYRENHRSPGSYDGCSSGAGGGQEGIPNAFIRIIGFDNVRQVQCISFIAYKPPGY